jgi:hypothetical protein
MGRQIVLNEYDLRYGGEMRIGQFLERMGVIDGGVTVDDFDAAPALQRREHHEQTGHAVAFVFVIVTRHASGRRGNGRARLDNPLPGVDQKQGRVGVSAGETAMLGNFDGMQRIAKLQAEPLTKSTVEIVKGALRMTSEAADQTRRFSEQLSNYFERLAGAKSIDETLRINSEFAAMSLQQFLSGVTKMAERHASLAKDASAPASEAVKAVSSSVTNIASRGATQTRGRIIS